MAEFRKTPDEHRWGLGGYTVTQLTFDPASVRLMAWTLDASFEIRIGTSFLLLGSNTRVTLDPENTPGLAPLLSLLGSQLDSIVVTRQGQLTLEFLNGTKLYVEPHQDFEAWEVEGSGNLEHVGYLASPGGGSPWGRSDSTF